MNKALVLAKNIVLTVFAFIYNFIPLILSIFALLIFEIFDSKIFSRVYAFLIFAIVLLILFVLQLVFIFRTDKISQIIVASTFLIDFVLYLTLTIYIYQKPNTILDDFIAKKFYDKDFKGFTSFFQTKHNCCAFGRNIQDGLPLCEDATKVSCVQKLHDSFNDNKPAYRGVTLFFTLLLIVILAVCILLIVLEFLSHKQVVSNEAEDDLSDLNEKSTKDEATENDTENPEKSKKSNSTLIVDSKQNSTTSKKNKSYVPLSGEASESEANKKLEQEIFFGKPKYDPYEADPYEN